MRLEDICTIFTDGDWIESKDQSESGIRLDRAFHTSVMTSITAQCTMTSTATAFQILKVDAL